MGGGWRGNSRWLDKLIEEHRIIRRASNALLLSTASSYMLNEKEPFEQVLPLYIEFKGTFILYHDKKEEVLATLAGLLGCPKYRLNKDLEDLHLNVEYRFKDLIETQTYIPEDWWRELVSRAAIYHEAMEDHIEHEEKAIIPKILDVVLKTGVSDQKISQVLEGIEANLGERFHERMLRLTNKIEERLSNTLPKSGTVIMDITGLKPYEGRIAIKEKIREIKDKKIYRLILINNYYNPTLFYHELLNTEPCLDQNHFRAKQLSEKIWVSMITFKEGCK
jgi:hemerythrin-like domain-containing protein